MSADTSREAALDRLVSQYLKKRKHGPLAPALAAHCIRQLLVWVLCSR